MLQLVVQEEETVLPKPSSSHTTAVEGLQDDSTEVPDTDAQCPSPTTGQDDITGGALPEQTGGASSAPEPNQTAEPVQTGGPSNDGGVLSQTAGASTPELEPEQTTGAEQTTGSVQGAQPEQTSGGEVEVHRRNSNTGVGPQVAQGPSGI